MDPARAAEPPAAAQRTASVVLAWETGGVVGCWDRVEFERAVDLIAGRRVFSSPTGAGAVLRVRLARTAIGHRAALTLETVDGRGVGTRELESEGAACGELLQATALAAVLTVDSLSTVAPAAPLRVAPSPRAAAQWRAEVTPTAALAWGRLPGVARGFGLRLAILPHPAWATEVALLGWLSKRAQNEEAPSADVSGWRLTFSECPRFEVATRTFVSGCFGGELNQTRGDGVGLQNARSATSLWAGLVAGAHVLRELGRHFLVRFGADLGVPLQRDYFYYTPPSGVTVVAFRPSAVDVDVELGLSLTIP